MKHALRSRGVFSGHQVRFVNQKCGIYVFLIDILPTCQLRSTNFHHFVFSNFLQSLVIVVSVCGNSLKGLITWDMEVVMNDALIVSCLGLYK